MHPTPWHSPITAELGIKTHVLTQHTFPQKLTVGRKPSTHPHAVRGLGTSASSGCSKPSGVAIHPIVWGMWEHKWGVGQGKFAIVSSAIMNL